MRKTLIISICLFILLVSDILASDNLDFRGYLRETPILWQPSPLYKDNEWRFYNILHQRSNFRYYASDNITAAIEIKTRLFSGENVNLMDTKTGGISSGVTRFDLDTEIIDKDNLILTTTIDRVWLNLVKGQFEFIAGRQRIAWGTNYVWNPIDIFNPSSPFDFDNEEMPGADGVRLIWYFGTNSNAEIAVAPQEEADETVGAGLIKINKWAYDWIFVGGRRDNKTVWGFGWAGDILNGGFRGEILYSVPRSDFWHENYLSLSVSGDYTFRNSLYLHSSILYNELCLSDNSGGINYFNMVYFDLLSPSKLSLFGQIAKDVTPLIRSDLSGIFNPYDRSWYCSPSVSWSYATNFDIVVIGLIFGGDKFTEFGDSGDILMLKAKYSF